MTDVWGASNAEQVEDVRERVERMLPRNRAPPRLLPSEVNRWAVRGLLYCYRTKTSVADYLVCCCAS
jgi:hypothetical protein